MAVDFEKVILLAKSYADDVRQVLPVEKVYLFGSCANGTATELSDIDICFFLNTFGGRRRVDVLKQLLGLMHGYKGVYFEPTAFTASEMENDNPFVIEVLRTGREI